MPKNKDRDPADDNTNDESIHHVVDIAGDINLTNSQNYGNIGHQVNLGPPKRVILPGVRATMLAILRQTPPARIGFASTNADVEAHQFKAQLMGVFRDAGWQVEDQQTFMFFNMEQGIIITIPFGAPEDGAVQVVAHALAQTGGPVGGNHGDMANECGIYVQVWHAP